MPFCLKSFALKVKYLPNWCSVNLPFLRIVSFPHHNPLFQPPHTHTHTELINVSCCSAASSITSAANISSCLHLSALFAHPFLLLWFYYNIKTISWRFSLMFPSRRTRETHEVIFTSESVLPSNRQFCRNSLELRSHWRLYLGFIEINKTILKLMEEWMLMLQILTGLMVT